jgi:hypothetical protein
MEGFEFVLLEVIFLVGLSVNSTRSMRRGQELELFDEVFCVLCLRALRYEMPNFMASQRLTSLFLREAMIRHHLKHC